MLSGRPPEQKGPASAAYPAIPELDRLLQHALSHKLATAAACMLSGPRARSRQTVLHHSLFGTARTVPPLEKLQPRALFDVGALTSTLVTATLAALLVSRGRLDLSRTLGTVAAAEPWLRTSAWKDIPLECLLDHTSGLPAEGPVFDRVLAGLRPRGAKAVLSAKEQLQQPRAATSRIDAMAVRTLGGPMAPQAKERLLKELVQTRPTAAPGSVVVPSALNALALGWALEAAVQKPLDEAFELLVTQPLDLTHSLHFVRCGPNGPWQPPRPSVGASDTVATLAACPYRQRFLQGECEDPIAYFLGGVAGHAGLFASVDAVFALLHVHLASLEGRQSFLNPGVVQRFWSKSKKVADSPFALGWQIASRHNGMAPGRWNSRSIGQLSATGSSAFIDPAFGVVGALLLNVSHGSHPEPQAAWDKLRLRVFDAMASEAQYAPRAGK